MGSALGAGAADGPPASSPSSAAGSGAPQPPCQASSHFPLRAQLAAAQPAAPGPRLETGTPLVLLEGHRGPEGAPGPRLPRSLVAVLASPFALTSSVLASQLFISAPVPQPAALRPARTPGAADAGGPGGSAFGPRTQEAPRLGLAHLSLGGRREEGCGQLRSSPAPRPALLTSSPSSPLPGQSIILG